ncbi:MAG TPA: hypothetical protein VLQ45_28785 [Thermoanaerobaculia bacterium]|nr:hypothetical protein [Thermoanaerobaculia bacterium]
MIAFEARACSVLYNLLLAGDGAGRPFLLPANVCPVVPLTFRKAGRPFELVDVSGPDLAMDEARCLERIGRDRGGIAGLLFVRTYGAVGDAAPLFRAAKELAPDLLVIDDRCLCRPDPDCGGRTPGADVTLWSTGYAKHVDVGFGGFAHLSPGVPYRQQAGAYSAPALEEIERRVKKAVARGVPFDGGGEDWLELAPPEVSWPAYRSGLLAALPEIDEHKRRLNAIYTELLPVEVCLPERFQEWRFNVLVPEPDELVARLFAAGLFASRHYASLGGVFSPGSFPGAEALHRRVVNLFNDRSFDEERARLAAGLVLEHLEEKGKGSPGGLPV